MKLTAIEPALVAIAHGAPDPINIRGTGTLISPDGFIVTADHLLLDQNGRLVPTLFGLRPDHPRVHIHSLSVVHRFTADSRDVAILQAISPALRLPHLPIGAQLEPGSEVFIAGFPLVFDKPYAWPLLRRGVIASSRYTLDGNCPILVLDLGSVPGFSGSPVLDPTTSSIIAVVKGAPKGQRSSDFCCAIPVLAADLARVSRASVAADHGHSTRQ